VSPQLNWKEAPAATKSFALTVYDPDAPTGSGSGIGSSFNIPATSASLPKNAGDIKANLAPAGSVQVRSDYSVQGYGGPWSPEREASSLRLHDLCGRCRSPRCRRGRVARRHRLQLCISHARQGSFTGLYGQ